MTKKQKRQWTHEGIPVDARDWTEADWRDLHEAMEKVLRRIRDRHKPKDLPPQAPR